MAASSAAMTSKYGKLRAVQDGLPSAREGGDAAVHTGLGGASPEKGCSWWSYFSFGWLNPLLIYGRKQPIMDEHLYELVDGDMTGGLLDAILAFVVSILPVFCSCHLQAHSQKGLRGSGLA